jgi:hypothetical protein
MSPSPQSEDLADVRPWDPEAKKFAQWHDDSVEDCFGRYPFTSNPFVKGRIWKRYVHFLGKNGLRL